MQSLWVISIFHVPERKRDGQQWFLSEMLLLHGSAVQHFRALPTDTFVTSIQIAVFVYLFLQKFFWKSYSSQHWVSSRLGLYLFCLHNLFFCKALTTAFCADFSNWIAWGKTLLCEWQCAMKQQLDTRCLTLWGGRGKSKLMHAALSFSWLGSHVKEIV